MLRSSSSEGGSDSQLYDAGFRYVDRRLFLATSSVAGLVSASAAIFLPSEQLGRAVVQAISLLAVLFVLAVQLRETSRCTSDSLKEYSVSVAADCGRLFLQSRSNPETYRGTVKRFSVKNGWGLISVDHNTIGDANRGDHRRRDVRFYKVEQIALSLVVGDRVVFGVLPDPEAPGWFRTVELRREGLDDISSAVDAAGSQVEVDAEQVPQALSSSQSLEVADLDDKNLVAKPSAAHSRGQRDQADTERVNGALSSSRPLEIVDVDNDRPATTPIVARRLVHAHLEVPLSKDQRDEERSFWNEAKQRRMRQADITPDKCSQRPPRETQDCVFRQTSIGTQDCAANARIANK